MPNDWPWGGAPGGKRAKGLGVAASFVRRATGATSRKAFFPSGCAFTSLFPRVGSMWSALSHGCNSEDLRPRVL